MPLWNMIPMLIPMENSVHQYSKRDTRRSFWIHYQTHDFDVWRFFIHSCPFPRETGIHQHRKNVHSCTYPHTSFLSIYHTIFVQVLCAHKNRAPKLDISALVPSSLQHIYISSIKSTLNPHCHAQFTSNRGQSKSNTISSLIGARKKIMMSFA